jgi:hypothetical protein
MKDLLRLAERWCAEGRQARERYGLGIVETICDVHARELREAVRCCLSEELTIAEAAQESGYSGQHLRALLAAGEIPNAGRKGRPRITRQDLPRKASVEHKITDDASTAVQPADSRHADGRRSRSFDAEAVLGRLNPQRG